LHGRRTVNQPRCEDWLSNAEDRFGLCEDNARRPAYGPPARDAAQPSLRSCRDTSSLEIAPFLACCRELRAPIIVLAGDHYVTTKCFDVWNLRATAHEYHRAEAFRTSELQHKRPTVEPAAVWANQSPGLRSCSTHGHHPGCNWIHQACAASSSERSPGTGMTRSAGLTMSSRQRTPDFRRTTRVPGEGPATPDPSASTTPTHSMRDWLQRRLNDRSGRA